MVREEHFEEWCVVFVVLCVGFTFMWLFYSLMMKMITQNSGWSRKICDSLKEGLIFFILSITTAYALWDAPILTEWAMALKFDWFAFDATLSPKVSVLGGLFLIHRKLLTDIPYAIHVGYYTKELISLTINMDVPHYVENSMTNRIMFIAHHILSLIMLCASAPTALVYEGLILMVLFDPGDVPIHARRIFARGTRGRYWMDRLTFVCFVVPRLILVPLIIAIRIISMASNVHAITTLEIVMNSMFGLVIIMSYYWAYEMLSKQNSSHLKKQQ